MDPQSPLPMGTKGSIKNSFVMNKMVIYPEIGEQYELEGIRLTCQEAGKACKECYMARKSDDVCRLIVCRSHEREDRKNVIFLIPSPIDQLVKKYAERLQVSMEELVSPDRTAELVNKRHVIWYVLRSENFKATEIAGYFHVTHVSIVHSTTKISNLIETKDKKILHLLDLLQCK